MDRHPQHSSFGGGGSNWLRDNGWGDSGQQQQSRSFGFGGWDSHEQQQQQQPRSFGSYWGATEEEEEEQRRRAKEIGEHGYDDAGAMDDDVPAAAAASSSSSAEPSTALGLAGSGWTEAVAAITQRKALKDKPAFKSLLVGRRSTTGEKSEAAAAAALPAASSGSAPPSSPYMKPIRFVRAKEHAVEASTGDREEASVLKRANRVGLAKPSLLSRAAPASKAIAAAAAPSLRAAPSLLAPFKSPKPTSSPFKPLVPGHGGSAAATSAVSGSGFALAHIFHVNYRPAQRKKKAHREGYLHLFRSSVTATAADEAASASSAASVSKISLIKSHLFSERGHLIDEQLGSRSVMQYDESITKPQRKNRNPFGFGGDGGTDSNQSKKKRKRGDEVDSDSDDSDDEGEDESGGFGFAFVSSGGSRLAEFNAESSSAPATTAASSASSSLTNVFAEGETVFIGSYECNLEEEITAQEYEKKKKIMTGELSAAPLSRFSTASSVSVLGAPLAPDNRGYILLAAQGLEANGGVIGTKRTVSSALKEPIAMVWRMQDSRPGVGFKEKPRVMPVRHDGGGGAGGHRGGRGGGRGGRF